MKKKEFILVLIVIAAGVIYNSIKSGNIHFYDGCSHDSRELLDRKYPVDFPQKEIQYTYNESDAAFIRQIKINNPAGDIEVGKSIDNSIRITPVIRVFHENKGKAENISKDIHLITREIGEKIAIDVESNEKFPYQRVRLKFKCLIPANVELDLQNKYGNIDINDVGQKITINESQGDLFVKNVASILKIKNNNGLVRLYDINGHIQLNSSHSQVKIKNIPSLGLKCSHSDLYITDVKEEIEITRAGYSNLEIENTGRLSIDAEHTKMKLINIKGGVSITDSHEPIALTDIQGDIEIKARHCRIDVNKVAGDFLIIKDSYSNVTINDFSGKSLNTALESGELDITFENITDRMIIKTSHADVTLKYPGSVQPAFNINSENGKIYNNTPGKLNILENREKQSLNTLEGKPQIIVNTKYADVFLKNTTILSTSPTNPTRPTRPTEPILPAEAE